MKTAALFTIYILAIAALAAGLGFTRRTRSQWEAEKKTLCLRLVQMDEPVAGNRQLSNRLDRRSVQRRESESSPDSAPMLDEQVRELAQLRSELTRLQEQRKEIENLQADTARLRASQKMSLEANPGSDGRGGAQSGTDSSGFEILEAHYGTARTNIDVTSELRDRIRSGKLKAIASNNLKGDPEFGQVKQLTIVYRLGDLVATNEFGEGSVIILPQE